MNDNIGPLNPNNMGVISKNLNDSIFINCKNIIKNIEEFVFNLLNQNKKYIIYNWERIIKRRNNRL